MLTIAIIYLKGSDVNWLHLAIQCIIQFKILLQQEAYSVVWPLLTPRTRPSLSARVPESQKLKM